MSRVLDDLISSAKSLADKAGKVTDKAVEYSKLKYQSMQLSSELRSLYEKLGNAVYTTVKSDFDNKELMDSIIEEIDHVKERLQNVSIQIAEYKNTVICPACGAVNEKDACYCSKCGNKFVPKEEGCCCDEECECGEDCCCDEECECGEECCCDHSEEKCCCESSEEAKEEEPKEE